MRHAARPVALLADVVLLAGAPVLLLAAALLEPLVGGRRALRVVTMLLAYAAHHLAACCALAALAAGRAGRERHYALMRWFVAGVTETVARCANVEVRVVDSEPAERALAAADRPAVVLSRHAGEGDSLLVLHHLLTRHRRQPRIVMHHALAGDPLIAALGRRLPNRFIDPRGGDTEREIAAMASGAGPRDAVVIFPEGRNFSAEQRERAIQRLLRAGRRRQAAWAREMRHVSAPRPGGALAAIDAAGRAHVVVLAHAGFPHGWREAWRQLPARQVIELRLWLADAPPDAPDARVDWLFGWWRVVDGWVAERERAGKTL